MFKKSLTGLICWVLLSGMAWGQQWEIDLNAGSKSASGGVHFRHFVDTGYIKFGGAGVYADNDDESYRLGTIDFLLGNDTLSPGLSLEVGLKGLIGVAEDDSKSADIGAVAFAANVEYVFAPDITPIPIEVFGKIIYAPDSLSFRDAESYLEFSIGGGVRIGRYASIRLSYTGYRMELESDSDSWDVNDDAIRIGLVMRF